MGLRGAARQDRRHPCGPPVRHRGEGPTFLGLLADLGYIGLHPDVVTGYKRRSGEKTLPEAKKAANAALASLRAIGERANAQLKQWRVLACDFRGHPRQLTMVVKAIQTVQYLIRDPFGTAGIGTGS